MLLIGISRAVSQLHFSAHVRLFMTITHTHTLTHVYSASVCVPHLAAGVVSNPHFHLAVQQRGKMAQLITLTLTEKNEKQHTHTHTACPTPHKRT